MLQPSNKIPFIIRSIALCLLLQCIISYKLWVPWHREFPMIPAFHFIPLHLGSTGDWILFVVMCLLLVFITFKPRQSKWIYALIGVFILFILEDITRFQPWIYLFGFILLIATSKRLKQTDVIYCIALLLSFTYFWSGFQKLNNAFTVEFFPWLMGPFGLSEFALAHRPLGFIPGLLELSAGILLLFSKTRRIGAFLAIAIHLFLLIALGPWALDWNKAIWPWNATMIFLLAGIFIYKPAEFTFKESRIIFGYSLYGYAILFLLGILPALNYINLWDYHLSMSLYSGNNNEAIFYYTEQDRKNIPVEDQSLLYYYEGTSTEFLLIDFWCSKDLESPFYPQVRYFKAVGRHLCDCMDYPDSAGIRINIKEKFTSKPSLLEFPCDSL